MRRWLWTLVLGTALALGAGCESSDGDATDTGGGTTDTAGGDTAGGEDTAGAGTAIATFATFNAGLAYDYVLYATERQPEIGPALAAFDADVVCLQEVWLVDDVEAVIEATSTAFPHVHWWNTENLPNEGEGPACAEGPAGEFRTCVEAAGCEEDARGLATCAQEECGPEFAALSPDCLTCLVANLSKPLDEIFQACAVGSTLYLYDGQLGTMILSKWPIERSDETQLDSTFNRRGGLFARVKAPTGEQFAVFCTHTTPEFDDVTYPGEFESWDDEQENQIEQLLTWMGPIEQDDDIMVLLGDMNDGPAIPPDIEGELEDNYQRFLDAGFVSPYPDSDDVRCTFCAENGLNASDTRNAVIDHTFFRGVPDGYSLTSERVLDEPVVTVTTEDGEATVPLSDHYGVRTTLWKDAE